MHTHAKTTADKVSHLLEYVGPPYSPLARSHSKLLHFYGRRRRRPLNCHSSKTKSLVRWTASNQRRRRKSVIPSLQTFFLPSTIKPRVRRRHDHERGGGGPQTAVFTSVGYIIMFYCRRGSCMMVPYVRRARAMQIKLRGEQSCRMVRSGHDCPLKR